MDVKIITAKYEVVYPFNILMSEELTDAISLEWKGLGEAIIYSPELVNSNKLKDVHYESRMRIDVTLDINRKQVGLKLDRFFYGKCMEAITPFLLEVWLTSKSPEADPHFRPIFIACKYYDSKGSPFINPDTGKSSYELPMPKGLVLSKDNWKEIANNLTAGKRRNLDEKLLLDAKCMMDTNRPQIAILLAAVACEFKVKFVCDISAKKEEVTDKLWNTMVETLRPSFADYQAIMSSLGINSLKTSHDPKIRALQGRVKRLFKHRNTIAHHGSIQGYKGKRFTATEVLSLAKEDIETAEQFVNWLDSQMVT